MLHLWPLKPSLSCWLHRPLFLTQSLDIFTACMRLDFDQPLSILWLLALGHHRFLYAPAAAVVLAVTALERSLVVRKFEACEFFAMNFRGVDVISFSQRPLSQPRLKHGRNGQLPPLNTRWLHLRSNTLRRGRIIQRRSKRIGRHRQRAHCVARYTHCSSLQRLCD